MKLVLTEAALADLEAIGDWIARDNPRRAAEFIWELRDACSNIPDMPEAHRLVPRYESFGIRRKIHGNYLIFYRIESKTIQIIHILNGAQDYEAILFP
ncbi:MAG: type II toxin-antitoxin system RelE/ParE family toxin [Rhodospirillales bacterium]|nr:type II toxin-antitoxin system RelE/ParE family toxin [Rhodospirillales bacterium]